MNIQDYDAIAEIIYRVDNPTNGMIERRELGISAMIDAFADYLAADPGCREHMSCRTAHNLHHNSLINFDRDAFISKATGAN